VSRQMGEIKTFLGFEWYDIRCFISLPRLSWNIIMSQVSIWNIFEKNK
jgi:hypothetical protein